MAERATYIRKIGEQQYEYGFVAYSKNFRKKPDTYSPRGVCSSVADAEACRSAISSPERRP